MQHPPPTEDTAMNLMLALLDRMLSTLLRIHLDTRAHRAAFRPQLQLQPIPIRSRRR
jgi:hypothetical protein